MSTGQILKWIFELPPCDSDGWSFRPPTNFAFVPCLGLQHGAAQLGAYLGTPGLQHLNGRYIQETSVIELERWTAGQNASSHPSLQGKLGSADARRKGDSWLKPI